MRVSFQRGERLVRWPFAVLEADGDGVRVRWRKGSWAAGWDEVGRMVRCGFFARNDVRIVLLDGRRVVVAGRGLPDLLHRLAPQVPMRTEQRRLFPLWHGDLEIEDRFRRAGR
jgi:hypothetical protein